VRRSYFGKLSPLSSLFSISRLYLALAAAYSDKPIRISNDRFQQFQSGIKRHASRIELTLGVSQENLIDVFRNHTILDGGGAPHRGCPKQNVTFRATTFDERR